MLNICSSNVEYLTKVSSPLHSTLCSIFECNQVAAKHCCISLWVLNPTEQVCALPFTPMLWYCYFEPSDVFSELPNFPSKWFCIRRSLSQLFNLYLVWMSIELLPLQLFVFYSVLVEVLDESLDLGSLEEKNHLEVVAHEEFFVSRDTSDEWLGDIVSITGLKGIPEMVSHNLRGFEMKVWHTPNGLGIK